MKEGVDAVTRHAAVVSDIYRRDPKAFEVLRHRLAQVLESTGLAKKSKVSVKIL